VKHTTGVPEAVPTDPPSGFEPFYTAGWLYGVLSSFVDNWLGAIGYLDSADGRHCTGSGCILAWSLLSSPKESGRPNAGSNRQFMETIKAKILIERSGNCGSRFGDGRLHGDEPLATIHTGNFSLIFLKASCSEIHSGPIDAWGGPGKGAI